MRKTYENNKSPTRLQLTALNEPLQRPTPTVAPVIPEDTISMMSQGWGGVDIHIEVETGSLYCEKMRIVIAAPSSMEEPREGEW